jgi:L-threonylcarbamoyladenylate synthase
LSKPLGNSTNMNTVDKPSLANPRLEMAEVLDWPRDNPAEVVVRAVEQLRADNLVAVPTDTAYALLAHGLSVSAATRLVELSGENPAVALADPFEVKDWLPNLDGLGWRLARHSWPGPLTLQSDAGSTAGLCQRLPPQIQTLLLQDGLLSLRCPGHAAVSKIVPLLDGPLLLAELPEATRVDHVVVRVNGEPVLILNDGPTYFGQCSTVVRVQGRRWTQTRPGVVSPDVLADLAQCRILFVCTGNTCRSPLAMALCRQLLAQRLGCAIAELPQHGFQVLSAGLAAITAEPASPEAVIVAQELGGDLKEHRSQPLTVDLLAQADCLFAMTTSHLRMFEAFDRLPGPAPSMLSPSGRDIADPIGYDIGVYRQCARQIQECLEERLPQLLET